MDVAAKLGIIVDANGARREISLTTDQLKALADGGKSATEVMKGLGAELGGGGGGGGLVPPDLPPRVNALAESIARMRAAASRRLDLGLSRQIAELDPFRLRTEQGTVATTKLATAMERMRASSRQKIDLGLAAQIEQLDPFQKGLSGVDEAAGHGRLSIGRLGNAVADLGAHLTGVHPILGKVVEVIGQFAVGHALTLGVIAGITAIAFAWDKYTEKVRKATEEQDKLVASSMEAFRTRALGPGGESANIATAAYGRISDLQQQRTEATSIMGRDIRPDQQRQRLHDIDAEIGQLQLLIKDAARNVDLARAREFAESIQTPFDYAVSRGQAILDFYNEAIAAQAQLNELAKSGNTATKDAAIQGLQQIQRILDQISLQRMGLADRPSTLLGLPTQTTLGGIRTTTSEVISGIQSGMKHGRGFDDFQGEIDAIGNTLSQAAEEIRRDKMPEAVRTAVQEATDQLDVFYRAMRLAAAKTAEDREIIAAQAREGRTRRSADAGAVENIQAQEQYGDQLAMREAALKLPRVFDADREAVVRHGEAVRQLREEIDVEIRAITTVEGALGNLEEGALQAAKGLLDMISPSNLAQGLLGGVIGTVQKGIEGIISQGSEFIRHSIFGSTSEQRAAAAAQRDTQAILKLTLDSLRAGVRGDTLAQQIDAAREALIGLLKQINDALPGTKNEAERNRQRAEAQALEAEQERQLREADAQRRREASEDLQVRLLRAQGQDAAADALALANAQQREYNQAVKDGADAAYLAMLTQVQAAEKTQAAMESLQNAVHNAPSGFRPEDYGLGQTMPVGSVAGSQIDGTPIGNPYPTGLPSSSTNYAPPRSMPFNRQQAEASNTTMIIVQMPAGAISIDGRESPATIAQKAITGFRQFAAASLGPNARTAAAIELMPGFRG